MNGQITGVFNILATPFLPDGQIDVESLRRLVGFQIDKGVHGLTILGVLGEAAKLTVDERQQVVAEVLGTVAGRVPVVVGTSHADVAICAQLSNEAVAQGAAGVMIAPPRFPDGATDDKVLAFYEAVAGRYAHPIVVQDFPPVNDVIMSADLLATLAERIPAARYLKLEDPPLMQKIGAVRARTDKFQVFGGLGGMFFLEELERGADGTMTGFAFSEILLAVFTAHRTGEPAAAAAIFDHYLPLIRFENQPVINLAIRKLLLRRRGAIAWEGLRKPFAPIDAGTEAELERILKRVGISDPTQTVTFGNFISAQA
jgi:4-hydroxy-tetrahydrodipicolinate synthase